MMRGDSFQQLEWHAFEVARTGVEVRYLDGVAADFPAACRAWNRQRRDSEEAAVIVIWLCELDGGPPPADEDPTAFEERVTSLAADLVEPAKSKAYNQLGDGRRAPDDWGSSGAGTSVGASIHSHTMSQSCDRPLRCQGQPVVVASALRKRASYALRCPERSES